MTHNTDASEDVGQKPSQTGCSNDAEPGHQADQSGPSVRSDVLFQGAKVVQILHEGAVYQLRTTKLGKLILTK